MVKKINDRYRDYQDRLDLVICGDCSTRSRLYLIDRDEMPEHDEWHEQTGPDTEGDASG